MVDNDLVLEIDGLIARLTINRPDSRNPLGQPGDGARFRAAADAINADKNLRCVIMTGAGPAFSAGDPGTMFTSTAPCAAFMPKAAASSGSRFCISAPR